MILKLRLWLIVSLALICAETVTASPEKERLQQIADEIKARRRLDSLKQEERINLVLVQEKEGVRFQSKQRFLAEWKEAVEFLLRKEVVMTRDAASKRITLETGAISSSDARRLFMSSLADSDLAAVELGESAIVLVTTAQLPK